MKCEIMIEILFMLLSKKRVTAEDISRRFLVSKRTVYRYLDELSLIVPIYVERGSKGGFSVVDSFRLPSTFLTEKEYAVVLQALVAFADELPGAEILSAINKIKANSKGAREISLNSNTLIIDSGPWGITDEYNNKLKVLAECVEKSICAQVCYRNIDGVVSQRTIEPHTLVLKQGIWYVYAYCTLRCDFRLFKVGRFESINVDNVSFERRNTEALSNVFGYRASDPDRETVVLEVESAIISEIEEWLGVECVREKIDEKYIVRAELPINSGLVSKVLGYGGKVRVLEPKSLIDRVISSASAIVGHYNNR